MCLTARALACLSASAFSGRDWLSANHVEKCLHSGEPMSRYGFCWRNSARAFSRLDLRLKSQG